MTIPNSPASSDREIVLSRTFDHPRSLVWSAYTEPEHFVHWYGPDGFTVTLHHMDVRTGGSTQFIMHGPDGKDYPNYMAYREVAPVELLAFDHGSQAGDPHRFEVAIRFDAVGDGTQLTSRLTFPTAEACEYVKGFGAVELGQQTLAKLGEYLRTMRPL